MRDRLRSLALSLCGLLMAAAASAQTTGSISGRVADVDGGVLPGVTVEARSAALQGSRAVTTDETGIYHLLLLPPGSYQLSFALDGFANEGGEVQVGLGREATLDVEMRPAAAETITVVSTAAVVDVSTASLGTNLDARAISTLPTGRNYSSVAQVAPGTSSDANPENQGQTTITVYGSSGAENTFYIDGINTTGVEYGFQGKELNFEFIQAVDVKTGGYEAEFGRSTGGIINVVTKSGGNELQGDVFGYYDTDSLQASPKDTVSIQGTVDGFTKKDFGVDLGGYLVKDKLWFFAAYDRVDNSLDSALPAGPQAGEIVTGESSRDLAAGKLTFNLSQAQSIVGTFFQDPREDSGAISDATHGLNGDPLTYLGKQELGGRDYAVRYDGAFTSGWVLNAQISRHEEENSVGPRSAAGDVIQYRTVDEDFYQRGGFGLVQGKQFQRDAYGVSASAFAGAHEVKAGLEYEEETAEVVKRMSGGQQVDIFANPNDPDRPVYRHFYWTTPTATLDNAPISQLTAAPKHKNTTAYVQDHWSIGNSLTFNFGVRWDRQQIYDRFGIEQIDLKDDYAPRLGFVWNPNGEGTSKIYGSYGRYYEQIPMDLVIRSFSLERQPRIFNFSPTSVTPDPDAEAAVDASSAILGGFTEPSDPNLKNQYMTEGIIGYERQVSADVSVGVKGIYRDYGRVIEDFLCADDGTYCIGNPGEGIMREVFTYDYSHTVPAPDAKRTFKGLELSANKRFANNWQGLASYLYSKLEGNFDGEYAPFTNIGADPNISAAYDYFDFFTDGQNLDVITNKGDLSNDRRHQFKVSGIYITPFKLSVGVSAYYKTGTPLTRYGYSDGYGRYEFFLTERGGEGRGPDVYEADAHLDYPIELGPVTLDVLLDVFNLLNAQRPILLDQRWGFQESDNALPTPANPNYGKPVIRTAPTSARIGLRVSF
jgi:hypothetical protein